MADAKIRLKACADEPEAPFWRTKSMAEMTKAEWESL